MRFEFRILGPLEVEGESGPLALGGQKQRALLAALLLEAGRVVATDRLVDLLWGEEAPKTATTSLQNSISRLRRELGADVLETRAPGYVLRVAPEQIDARRFELALRDARRAGAEERRELLQRALELWRGPALADFAFEQFAQPEIRRLEELRLVAHEERIEADLELGRHGDVVGELEVLVRRAPAPRDALPPAACSRCTGRAGRRRLSTSTRMRERASSRSSASSPAPELKRLQSEILRHEAGIAAPGASRAETDDDAEILGALLAGRVVPVLGLDGVGDLAAHLASAFSVPDDRPVDLARVSQYVATMKGSGPLYDELHSRFEAAVEPTALHRFLAQLPGAPARAGSAAPADREHELRPRARARLRGSGRGGRHRRLRRRRDAPRPLLASPAWRGAEADRRSEHLCDRALARAAHDPAQAARRCRPAPRAGMGELRHHRGRLHRLPRTLRARPPSCPWRSPRSCDGATFSSSATRWPTGTCGSS